MGVALSENGILSLVKYGTGFSTCVADPHHFHADLDPALQIVIQIYFSS
jgi:hypothetical protein